jgi:ElaB/YqjD/DUF883 family membrane-anchored ribosome-binding protein
LKDKLITKNAAELQKRDIDTLARIFSIDILIIRNKYNENFTDKNRTIATPLVILVSDKDVNILYKRNQALQITNDLIYSKESSEELKKENDSLNNELKDLKNALEQLMDATKDFAGKIVNFIKEINDYSIDNGSENLDKQFNLLKKTKLMTSSFITREVFEKNDSSFKSDMEEVSQKLNNLNIIRNLKTLSENKEANPEEQCKNCGKSCSQYEGLKFSCGHILDYDCIEK